MLLRRRENWLKRRVAQPLDARFFSVAPSGGDSLPQLDGLRAIAVIMIFMRHAWGLSGQWKPVLNVGMRIDLSPIVLMMANGVDLFFVLSGFLLSRQFISAHAAGKPRPDVRRYFQLRAFRILPAFYVSLAVALIVFTPAIIDPSLVYSVVGLKAIAANLFVMQTIAPWAYGLWGQLSPYWTLTIEVLFYMMLPFMVRFFLGRRWLVAVPAFLVVTWGWLYLIHSGHFDGLTDFIVNHGGRAGSSPAFARFFLSKQLPAHLFDFACGIGAACAVSAVKDLDKWRAKLARAARWSGLAVVLVGMYVLGRITQDNRYYEGLPLMFASKPSARIFYYFEEPAMGFGFGLFIFGLCCRGVRSSTLSWKPLRFIGIIGFGVYLFHMPFLYLYTKMPWVASIRDLKIHWIVLMLFTGAVVVVVASILYLTVEKPFIDYARRRAPAVAVAAPADTGSLQLSAARQMVTDDAETASIGLEPAQ